MYSASIRHPQHGAHPAANRDLNDRGKGRTVETQGGGVAVLSALWRLQNMAQTANRDITDG